MQELVRVRTLLGWTQERMAAYFGYSTNYYARMERGVDPAPETMVRDVLVLEHLHALCGLVGLHR